MAPKKQQQNDEPDAQTEEQKMHAKESERLTKKAQEVGLLSDMRMQGQKSLLISKCELNRVNPDFALI